MIREYDMELYSEDEAADMYVQAIKDNRDMIETDVLYPSPWVHLRNSRCIVEELEALMKKRRIKRAVSEVVDLVLEKGDIETLTAFSKAIYSISAQKGNNIFPFADRIGGIPVTVPKKGIYMYTVYISSLFSS